MYSPEVITGVCDEHKECFQPELLQPLLPEPVVRRPPIAAPVKPLPTMKDDFEPGPYCLAALCCDFLLIICVMAHLDILSNTEDSLSKKYASPEDVPIAITTLFLLDRYFAGFQAIWQIQNRFISIN